MRQKSTVSVEIDLGRKERGMTKTKKWLIGIGLFVLLIFLVCFLLGGGNAELIRTVFSEQQSGVQMQEELKDIGLRGYITFGILSMLQVVLTFLPAEPVQVMAGLTFGFFGGFLCCFVGVLLGNSLIYLLYRSYGDRFTACFKRMPNLDPDKLGGSYRLALIVLLLYLMPVIPYGVICLLAAATQMKYPRYILITTLGSIPTVCIGVGLGDMAISLSWILSLGIFLVLVCLLIVAVKNKEHLFCRINAMLEEKQGPYAEPVTVSPYPKRRLWLPYQIARMLIALNGVRYRGASCVEQVELPCVVLCTHGAFVDFFYAGALIREYRPHFPVARLYFYHRAFGKLLKHHGCYPKSMFALDRESVQNSIRVLRDGGMLAMMPEARLSTAGEFEDIQPGTFAFLKKMGVPVYRVLLSGDYLCKPKWAKGMRRGALVEAKLDLLFTQEQVQTMSVSELEREATRAMYYNEWEWLREHPRVRYRDRRLAEGLENILTRCPTCGARYSLATKGHSIRCTACGLTVTMDDRYVFSDAPFSDLGAWYRWQTEQMQTEIRSDESYRLESRVVLKHASQDGRTMLRVAGEGTCVLDRKGLTYVGTEDGQTVTKLFPIKTLYRILFGAGEDFEIYEGKEIFYFVPEERRSCVDWYIASRILKDESEK